VQLWWGSRGEQGYVAVPVTPLAKALPADQPAWDRLLQPPAFRRGVPAFGADLLRLGLVRKK